MLFSEIGNEELFGFLPVPLLIYVAVAVLIGIMLSKSRFGMQMYLFGTNEKASLFAGMNNTRIVMRTYMVSGLNMFENISNFYRDIIWGGVLILVLLFNYYINKREQNRLLKTS